MNWTLLSAMYQALLVSVMGDGHLQGHSDPILGPVLQDMVRQNLGCHLSLGSAKQAR